MRGLTEDDINMVLTNLLAVLLEQPDTLTERLGQMVDAIRQAEMVQDHGSAAFLPAMVRLLDEGVEAVDDITPTIPEIYKSPWEALRRCPAERDLHFRAKPPYNEGNFRYPFRVAPMADTSDVRSRLRQVYQLIQRGQNGEARQQLADILRAEPENADAWYLSSFLVDADADKRKLLRRALASDPTHAYAQRALEALGDDASDPISDALNTVRGSTESSPLPATPVLTVGTDGPTLRRALWIGGGIAGVCLVGTAILIGARPLLQSGVLAPKLTSTPSARQVLETLTRAPSLTTRAAEAGAATSTPRIPATTTSTPTPTRTPTRTPTPTGTPTPTPTVTPPAGVVGILGFDVIDAEYSNPLERIILVSTAPNQLHIYDPETVQDTTISLVRPPESVSVSPNGLFAAVDHDSLVSYVDLQTAQVVKTIRIALGGGDILLAGNGWAYIANWSSEPSELFGLNVETEELVRSEPFMFFTVTYLRLHSNGRVIYALAETGAGEIQRIDLDADGTPHVTRSYHPLDHNPCDFIWLSDDSRLMFSACGATFRTSDDPEADVAFDGNLVDQDGPVTYVVGVAHAPASRRVVAITRTSWNTLDAPDQINFWEDSTLNPLLRVDLPIYHERDRPFYPYGRYIFTNSAGTRYYVIYYIAYEYETLETWETDIVYGLIAGDIPQ